MESHFWWRPGWRPGRTYLTWHVLPDQTARRYAAALQERLTGLAHLAPVPLDRLHVTGPGVGFVDEVPGERVAAMVGAAQAALAAIPPFTARLSEPVVAKAAVVVPVAATALGSLRATLRAAMRQAGIEPPGRDDEAYTPHVSIAYATGPAERDDVVERLAPHASRREPTRGPLLTVDAAHLLGLRMVAPESVGPGAAGYDWGVRALAPLGTASRARGSAS